MDLFAFLFLFAATVCFLVAAIGGGVHANFVPLGLALLTIGLVAQFADRHVHLIHF